MKIILGVFTILIFALILTSGCTGTTENNQSTTNEKSTIQKESLGEEVIKQNSDKEDLVTVQPAKISNKINEAKVNGIDKTKPKIIGPILVKVLKKFLQFIQI
jgi:hypothetical protein